MGTVQSSPANGPSVVEELEVISSVQITGERGRIEEENLNETSNQNIEETSFIKVNRFADDVINNVSLETSDSESDYSSDDSDDEDEEDTERCLIFEDIKNLRLLAKAFHHPEASVRVDGIAPARCYFDRYSAPVQENNEREHILADTLSLKKLALHYAHPEIPVSTSDPSLFGRNYFTSIAAIDMGYGDESEERAQILADAAALKKHAVDYAHPEIAVFTTDPSASARNYFSRPSAPTNVDDDLEERAQILADAAVLKKLAVDYAHPEVAVSTTDASVSARNYFSRPSAPTNEDDDSEVKAQILADAAVLKKLAVDYAHPEIAVSTTDPCVSARNYFSRPSAPTNEGDDDLEERAQILADVAALKKLAVDYAHPEAAVSTTDASVFARNYFSRPSAPTNENDDSEEKAQILADAAVLKKLAVDYAHPEIAVSTTDASVSARNYFSRPSAPTNENDDSEERAQILADAAVLKKLAVDYAHPEIAVSTTDPCVSARNYFSRFSAFEEEGERLMEERGQVMADVIKLRNLAIAYAHPEHGVTTTDPTVFGRNYFNMLSASKPLEILDVPCPTEEIKDVTNAKTFNKQQSVSSKLSVVTDGALGNVKRSPSTVILFGLGNDDGSAY